MTQNYYITTAIAYPNGAPHMGHAYEAIATDALARFHRLTGKNVFFIEDRSRRRKGRPDAESLCRWNGGAVQGNVRRAEHQQ